jgi:hypothetical protein
MLVLYSEYEMLSVYLDQNKWIDLARARYGRQDGERFRIAYELAAAAQSRHIARFPLSTIHYIEMYNTKNAARRDRLARTMQEVSGMETIVDSSRILPVEIDRALHSRFGRPLIPRRVEIFGVGVGHAFGIDDTRYHVPDELRHRIENVDIFELRANELMEFELLAGPPEDFPLPWLVTDAHTGPSKRFKQQEIELAQKFESNQIDAPTRDRTITAWELMDIWDQVSEGLIRAGIGISEFLELGAEGLTEFLEDLPSRHVAVVLQRARHRDSNLPRKDSDLLDIAALAVAVAYCDVVVTERFWTHLLKSNHLDELFGTTVLSDVAELSAILAGAAKPPSACGRGRPSRGAPSPRPPTRG